MSNIIKIPDIYRSDKYHTLVPTDAPFAYEFHPSEEWMPVYLTFDNENNIVAIDTDGMGCMLTVGTVLGNKKIVNFENNDSPFIIAIIHDINPLDYDNDEYDYGHDVDHHYTSDDDYLLTGEHYDRQ